MPTFHFLIEYGDPEPPERFAVELPNVSQAGLEAVMLAGQLLKEGASRFWQACAWSLSVEDAAGLVLFSIDLSLSRPPR